jgi:glyoxylase-like metal-dependent hydrolase (beta-lactamase superfamily II)
MSWYGVLVSAILGGLVSASASSQLDLTQTGYLQKIVPVEKGVWLLAQPKFQVQPIGNVTIIEQRDGLVLVDAGGSKGSGERIVEWVRSLSHKPVKAVIISQWHGDKPQGLSEILKAWPGARTISTVATQHYLTDPATMNTPGHADPEANAKYQKLLLGYEKYVEKQAKSADSGEMQRHYQELSFDLGQWARDLDGAVTLTTKESFTDKLVIDDPDRPVQILFLGRANTDGDAEVWLPKQRILVAGETVILPFPYGFESYPAEWIGVLEKLRAMPFRILLPGHGMPQKDRVQIDRIVAALKDVRAQVGPLAAHGLPLKDIQTKVDLSADGAAFVGNDPWLRKWFASFWAEPIINSAYKEARGEAIVQTLKG